jgi:hypothetical protein
MPVCRFGRADRCRRLAELASFGRDEGAKQTFYGLRAHLRVCWPGVICDARLVPANLHDLAMAEELVAGVRLGTGGSGLLEPCSCRAPAQARPPAPGATAAVSQGQGGEATEVGDADETTDRDRDRPAGRALPRQTGRGPRWLASVVTLAAQAAQPHPGRVPVPASRSRLAPVRWPDPGSAFTCSRPRAGPCWWRCPGIRPTCRDGPRPCPASSFCGSSRSRGGSARSRSPSPMAADSWPRAASTPG